MPREFARSRRVADQIQRELAELLRGAVKDPRVGLVTLTGVDLSPDYTHAKVYFTTLGGSGNADEVRSALHRTAGFLRRELGRRVRIHHTPELHFVFDESVERGAHISALLDQVAAPAPPDVDAGGAG